MSGVFSKSRGARPVRSAVSGYGKCLLCGSSSFVKLTKVSVSVCQTAQGCRKATTGLICGTLLKTCNAPLQWLQSKVRPMCVVIDAAQIQIARSKLELGLRTFAQPFGFQTADK